MINEQCRKTERVPIRLYMPWFIGEVLPLQIEHGQVEDINFQFSGLYRNEQEFFEKNRVEKIDILIMEYPTIQEDQVKHIFTLFEKISPRKLILIYGFTNSAAKKLLQRTDFILIEAPSYRRPPIHESKKPDRKRKS